MSRLPRLQIILGSAISWVIVNFTIYPLLVWAQPSISTNNKNFSKGSVRQQPPQQSQQQSPDFSGDGRPGRRTGGGSRSPCPPIEPPLTALMPVTNLGKTVAERPTFLFYVPYSPQAAPAGEFVLQSEQGHDIYRTPFTLPKTPGFVSFNTPSTAAPLEINKPYRWYFKLYCEPQKVSAPVFVDGWVQRVELSAEFESQLRSTKQREYYVVYAANGIWYDALAHLAQLRLANPANARLNYEWASLLGAKGVGLSQLSKVPMVGSAILEQRIGVN